MLDCFEVAVQVQHHIGIAGQALQYQALGLQGGAGRVCVQAAAQVFADQCKVVRRVLGEVFFDQVADAVRQVDEVAIEVLAALQFKTPQWCVQQHLLQAHRVGHRDQNDLALQSALLFQLGQTALEVPGYQHARQLVGVQ